MSEEKTSSFGFRDVKATEKVAMVRGVFESVASRYDLMNDVMSAGVHRLWKDAACARLNPQPGEVIVDCAGGTGDMSRRLVKLARAARGRRGGDPVKLFLVDYNQEMVKEGVLRAERDAERGQPWPEISFAVGDAMGLALPDQSADAYIISFGIRNVADVQKALNEAYRVLKPGGRFFCLEFSQPVTEGLKKAYDAYSFGLIPQMGEWVAGDRDSYQYLVESIRRFPTQDAFKTMITEAGFKKAGYTNYSAGVVALHHGLKL